jgi:hypothetical protein
MPELGTPTLTGILLGMDRDAIQRAFDDVFDQALIFHGYTDYMRDYELITYATAAPSTGIQPSFDRYRFSVLQPHPLSGERRQ